MKINYLRAKNFLAIEDEIDIDFTKYGNIINIKGTNLDYGEGYSNGAGKCFGWNTPVLMYDGTIRKVQDVKVDDLVMGNDSSPRKVLALGRGKEMMYKVIPTKGRPYVVNASHILTLKNRDKKYDRYKSHPNRIKGTDYFSISVKDYIAKSNSFKLMTGGYRSGVDFPSREVKIDPYFLGVWLGDGNSDSPHITSADHEIVDVVYQEAKSRNLAIRIQCPERTSPTYCLSSGIKKYGSNSALNDLRHYDLIYNKHIPIDYKCNSRKVRLELLAGILDTDGHYTHGGYDFISKFRKFANDVVYLARSLGLAAYMKPCKKSSQNGTEGTYYRVSINGNCDQIPVHIPRKKCPPRKINKDSLVVGIKVKPIGVDKYYGFQVDGNGLFLLGDFTVVHNSSLVECLVYALYGKLIKGLNHKEAINMRAKKGLEVEIRFDEYRIIRCRKPDELKLWRGKEEITKGGMPATQELINDIIGLHCDSFSNVVCFGQHNERSFLRCDAAEKRAIAENLLSLDKYIKFNKIAKEKKATCQDNLKNLASFYESAKGEYDGAKNRLNKLVSQQEYWKANKDKTIESLISTISSKKKQLQRSPNGEQLAEYESAQIDIKRTDDEIVLLESNKTKIALGLEKFESMIQTKRDERQELLSKISGYNITSLVKEIAELEANIKDTTRLKGTNCPVCRSNVEDHNIKLIIEHLNQSISKKQASLNILNKNRSDDDVVLREIEKKLADLMDMKKQTKDKESTVQDKLRERMSRRTQLSRIAKPDLSSESLVIEKEIEYLLIQLKEKRNEVDPYVGLMEVIKQELIDTSNKVDKYRDEIQKIDRIIPYYEFWIRAFGDDGIRSLVLDEIMPALNGNINYWLQFLIDNKIQIRFNNQLDEKIERYSGDGNQFVYNSLSGGEHQRIDLAISLAFAHATMLTSGSCPSIIALDEVGTNLDRPGIHAIYKTICELSRERQVLVTTHHPELQELLSSYDTIEVIMKNGVTSLRK